MRVALYARVSTSDKDQDPMTQLLPLREFAQAQGWQATGEFVNTAFRSVAHMAQTVEQLRRWGVGLRSYSEPWLDTSGSSPAGDLMLNIMASFAQFEKALIAERVKAGMARAKKQGKTFGRRRKLNGEFEPVRPLVESGQVSLRKAATMFGVGKSTIARMLALGKAGMVSRKGSAADAPQSRVQ